MIENSPESLARGGGRRNQQTVGWAKTKLPSTAQFLLNRLIETHTNSKLDRKTKD